jgi:hypothetical protein
MPARTPEERILVARIAAAERWGRTKDRTAATADMRAGWRAKLAREVDPDGTMPPAEVERRVDDLVRAHMLRMSLKAKSARRKAREQAEIADQAEAELDELEADAELGAVS